MRVAGVDGRGYAFDQVQRRQHEVLFVVGPDAEQVVLCQLPEDEREQVGFAVVLDLLPDSPLD